MKGNYTLTRHQQISLLYLSSRYFLSLLLAVLITILLPPPQAQAENPSKCLTTIANSLVVQTTIPTTETIVNSLESEIRRSHKRGIEILFNKSVVREVKSGKKLPDQFANGVNSFDNIWKQSFTEPVPIELPLKFKDSYGMDAYNNGLILFHGDIYSDSYFFRNALPRKSATNSTSTELMNYQPWLEWNPKNKTYSLRTKGAQERIIENIFPQGTSPTVYRGVSKKTEMEALKIFQQLGSINTPNESKDIANRIRELVKIWNTEYSDEILMSQQFKNEFLKVADRIERSAPQSVDLKKSADTLRELFRLAKINQNVDSIFFTADLATARKWGAVNVIEVTIPRDRFLNLSKNKEVYVGFETQSEIGFVSKDAQRYIFDNWKIQDPNWHWSNPRAD